MVKSHHTGPLRVQKSLYPEGKSVCHTVVLHPPGGVVGGDELRTYAKLRDDAHVVITTPGATKWYRSAGRPALQQNLLVLKKGAVLEWLQQEAIFFDQCNATIETEIHLERESTLMSWDILCFGRHHSGERFRAGSIRGVHRILQGKRLIWLDQMAVDGGSHLLTSPVGFAGFCVQVTGVFYSDGITEDLVNACKQIQPENRYSLSGITLVNGLIIARLLCNSSEEAKRWLFQLWELIRPMLIGRVAEPLRIWRT